MSLEQHCYYNFISASINLPTDTEMLTCFRLADPTMEARSVRRGALQLLAAAEVPLPTLMLFSGHTNQRTLLRYLNWGVCATEQRSAMAVAGAALTRLDIHRGRQG